MFQHKKCSLVGVTFFKLDEDDLQLAKTALANLLHDQAPLRDGPFPGPMPVPVTVENLKSLSYKRKNYIVAEKTDGTRCLLFLCRLKGVKLILLVDRKYQFFIVNGSLFTLTKQDAYLFENGGSLFDGELVSSKTADEKLKYFVFDVFIGGGHDYRKLDYISRIHRCTVMLYHHLDQDKPFEVRLKRFIALKHFDEFMNHYRNIKTQIAVDGIIFSPMDMQLSSGRNINLLKWKPPIQNTIDFVYQKGGVLCLSDFCKTKPIATLLTKDVQSQFDSRVKLNGQTLVIECEYDTEEHGWKFVKERTDKNMGNNTRTYLSTLQLLKSPVCMDDLISIFVGPQIGPSPVDQSLA